MSAEDGRRTKHEQLRLFPPGFCIISDSRLNTFAPPSSLTVRLPCDANWNSIISVSPVARRPLIEFRPASHLLRRYFN